jgi:hypothetical protein
MSNNSQNLFVPATWARHFRQELYELEEHILSPFFFSSVFIRVHPC